jgi:uncharacterized protein YukE
MSSSSSSVKSSPIKSDIEAILSRQRDECENRPILPTTTQQLEGEEEPYPPYGVIQPRRMVLPNKSQPNILNQAMAEEAAMKYEQKQSQIQQAVAELANKKKKNKEQTKSNKQSTTLKEDDDMDVDPTEDTTETTDCDDCEVAVVEEQQQQQPHPVDANETARAVWQQVRKSLRPLRSGWEPEE